MLRPHTRLTVALFATFALALGSALIPPSAVVPSVGAAQVARWPGHLEHRDLAHATTPMSVAVIDFTGFDATNPNFASNVLLEVCLDALGGQSWESSHCPGYAPSLEGPGSSLPQTGAGGTYLYAGSDHGTMVASVVAGTLGVSPNTPLILIRSLYGTDIALKWVAAHAAQYNIAAVVMSSGSFNTAPSMRGYVPCQQMTETVGAQQISLTPDIAQLASEGVAFVVASGNDSSTKYIDYPSCLNGVIAVGATQTPSQGGATQVADYSNVDANLALLAPGEPRVAYEPVLGQDTVSSSQVGTSFAAPYVAGLIAEIRTMYPTLTNDQVLAVLRQTGTLVNDVYVKDIPAANPTAALAFLASGATIPSLSSTFTAQLASVATTTPPVVPTTTTTTPPVVPTTTTTTPPDASSARIAQLTRELRSDNVAISELRREIAALRARTALPRR